MHARVHLWGQVVAFCVRWKRPRHYFLSVSLDSLPEQGTSITEAPNEFRGWREGQIEDIVEDKNLSITPRACTDANCRDLCRLCNLLRQFARNSLEHESHSAGFF